MLELLKAIFFGIVEGITEWLPISSTGHLILLNEFISLDVSDEFFSMFEVVIQLGAILAVVVLFIKEIWPFSTKEKYFIKKDTFIMWFKIVVACIPAAIIELAFGDVIEELFYNYIVIAAVFPGTSRSGATILGGILLGVSRSVAAEFTFFLAIPVMFGASLIKVLEFGSTFSSTELMILCAGMLTAFLVSVIVIRFLMGYIKKHDFKVFGWYRIILGALVLIYFTFIR